MSLAPFAERFAKARAELGPLVFGLDPSADVLRDWGLADDADGLERFVDIAVTAASGSVAVVKPQSAFYERHGWKGIRALGRLIEECRSAGVLVLLDAKRGDVGTTNEAYAQAYLGDDAAMPVDALTVTPYLGFGAMGAFAARAVAAGAALFVVTRSSNAEGRDVQAARQPDGATVEQHLILELGAANRGIVGEAVGPFGAVFGPTHSPPAEMDLNAMGGLFLAPGVGAQGATVADVAACFAACPDRVLPSASRSLLAAGPDVAAMQGAMRELGGALWEALGS
jgi:orotidine-5'-phosphate decarboxylase